MKRIFAAATIVFIITMGTTRADALQYFTYSQQQLLQMEVLNPAPIGSDVNFVAWELNHGMEFITYPVPANAILEIGNIEDLNLSSHEGIKLNIHNSSYLEVSFRLFVRSQTGGTYVNGWTLLNQDQQGTLTLNFEDFYHLEDIVEYGFQTTSPKAGLIHGAVAPVPEPATAVLFTAGVLGLVYLNRQRKKDPN